VRCDNNVFFRLLGFLLCAQFEGHLSWLQELELDPLNAPEVTGEEHDYPRLKNQFLRGLSKARDNYPERQLRFENQVVQLINSLEGGKHLIVLLGRHYALKKLKLKGTYPEIESLSRYDGELTKKLRHKIEASLVKTHLHEHGRFVEPDNCPYGACLHYTYFDAVVRIMYREEYRNMVVYHRRKAAPPLP
jgi:hypothetical protein